MCPHCVLMVAIGLLSCGLIPIGRRLWLRWRSRPSVVKRQEADRDEVMAQAERRAKTIERQVDLASLGVHAVTVGGVTMWSANGSHKLHPVLEEALAELGLAVIITIDGVVFVEPFGGES